MCTTNWHPSTALSIEPGSSKFASKSSTSLNIGPSSSIRPSIFSLFPKSLTVPLTIQSPYSRKILVTLDARSPVILVIRTLFLSILMSFKVENILKLISFKESLINEDFNIIY
jgi:hypothetical protein